MEQLRLGRQAGSSSSSWLPMDAGDQLRRRTLSGRAREKQDKLDDGEEEEEGRPRLDGRLEQVERAPSEPSVADCGELRQPVQSVHVARRASSFNSMLLLLFATCNANSRDSCAPTEPTGSECDCDPRLASAELVSPSAPPCSAAGPNGLQPQRRARPSSGEQQPRRRPPPSVSHLRAQRRNSRSKLVAQPLVRLFVAFLLAHELYLAVQWGSEPTGRQHDQNRHCEEIPLASRDDEQLLVATSSSSTTTSNNNDNLAPACARARHGHHQPWPSLNNLINLANSAGLEQSRLQSMVVSLFAFPLCGANELVGHGRSADKDKGLRDLPDLAAGSSSSSSLVALDGREAKVAPGTSKTTTATTETATTNVTTYQQAQPEMPMNLAALPAGSDSLLASGTGATKSTTSPSLSAGSPTAQEASAGGQQLQLDPGQNNSNNNNNNETAPNRNPHPKLERVAEVGRVDAASGARSTLAAASVEGLAFEQQQPPTATTTTTGRPKSGSYAQAYDPNSSAKEATPTGHGGSKTKQETATEEANLTMTMTRPSLAKKMRQKQQQQQQQKHLTMTSKSTMTTTGRDSPLWSVGLDDKSGPALNSVVCNSRCQCVQLEFAADEPSGQAESFSSAEQADLDKSGISSSQAELIMRRANNNNKNNCSKLRPIETMTNKPTGTETAPSTSQELSTSKLSATSKTDGELGAADNSQSRCDESPAGQEDDSSGSTRIALIEFSQDYSFDGELDELAEPDGDSPDDDSNYNLRSEQTPTTRTTTTTTTTSTTTTTASTTGATGNGPHHHHEPLSGGASSSSVGPTAVLDTDRSAVSSSSSGSLGGTTATIKQPDDQSKVVNVSSAAGEPSGGQAAPPPPASRLMLSIKDNKTGSDAANSGEQTGAAELQVRPAKATLAAGTVPDGAGGAEQPQRHSTDKDSGLSTQLLQLASAKRVQQQQQQPASAGNFYPFLGANHHLHQRHHLTDHQMGPAASGLPGTSFLVESQVVERHHQRLGGGGASSTIDAKRRQQTDAVGHRAGDQSKRPIKRISPLRSRSLSVSPSPDEMVDLLNDIKQHQVQSVSLRSSKLKFELWTEIYGLLAVELRQNLFHLDLAHNDLIKLGVTFTGYIEHHLAYQLLVHNNQSWPFTNQQQHATFQTSLNATANQQQQLGANYLNLIQLQQLAKSVSSSSQSASTSSSSPAAATTASSSQTRRPQLRHPNLGDGKLFNAVRSRLPVNISLLMVHLNSNASSSLTAAANHLLRSRLQQAPTVLHQASQLRALDLSHNKLRWLINDQFRILKHVQSIRLDHNQIRFIHQQAFNGLESLKYLNLNYNRIQTIYMEQFQTNYNLLALFMKSNYLTFLRAGSFASLNQLKRLDLSKNRFTFLGNNAFVGLDSLQVLNLSSNQFVHVPSTSFHSLASSLQTLDMSRNLLAQLMPGTFFHLKLERLLLNNNDQLVAIDRGAFWDLPYLSYLSLESSQVLIGINSQAFVAVPNLQTINYDDCQLLDLNTKQMLDNITTATTLRLLKQQQPGMTMASHDADPDDTNKLSLVAGPSVMKPVLKLATSSQQQMAAAAIELSRGLGPNGNELDTDDLGGLTGRQSAKWLVKYVYSLACVVLIVIALKLVFKYTPTRHYFDMRRRRRRVYQSSSASSCSASSHHSSASSCSSDERINHAIDDDHSVTGGLDYTNADDDLQPQSSSRGESFMMRELQPDNVIVNAGTRSQIDAIHRVASVVDVSLEIDISEPPQDAAMHTMNAADCQFNLDHQDAFLSCPDCCQEQYSATGVGDNNLASVNQTERAISQEDNVASLNQVAASSLADDGDSTLPDAASPNLNQQQLVSRTQSCDTTTGTTNDDSALTISQLEQQQDTVANADFLATISPPIQPASSLSDLGDTIELCGQHELNQHQFAHPTQQVVDQPDLTTHNNGVPSFYGSFDARTGRTVHQAHASHQWAEQSDCRLFHCNCMRCAAPDLVGVNGFI